MLGRPGRPSPGSRTGQSPVPAGPIRIRLTVPEGAGEGPRPGLVYIHGGGWVVGSIGSHDNLCRSITAALADVSVISVDYRLGSRTPVPRRGRRRPGRDRICLPSTQTSSASTRFHAWPSAAMLPRGTSPPPWHTRLRRDKEAQQSSSYQLLLYPATDADMNTDLVSPENAEGYLLTARRDGL